MEAARHPWPTLGVLLMRDGIVSKETLEAILAEQQDVKQRRISGRRLGEILVERGLVTPTQVARLIAEQYELPYIELDVEDIDLGIATRLDEATARRFSAVPVGRRPDGSILLAIADPATVIFSDELRRLLDSDVHFAVVGPEALETAIALVKERALNGPTDVSVADPATTSVVAPFTGQRRALAHLWPPLGALLLRDGLVTEEDLEIALAQQRLSTTQRLGEILADRGVVSRSVVARHVAEQYELEFVDLAGIELDAGVARRLPEEVARAYSALPIVSHDDGSLVVAIADPTNVFYSDELRRTLGVPLTFVVASSEDIDAALERILAQPAVVVRPLLHEAEPEPAAEAEVLAEIEADAVIEVETEAEAEYEVEEPAGAPVVPPVLEHAEPADDIAATTFEGFLSSDPEPAAEAEILAEPEPEGEHEVEEPAVASVAPPVLEHAEPADDIAATTFQRLRASIEPGPEAEILAEIEADAEIEVETEAEGEHEVEEPAVASVAPPAPLTAERADDTVAAKLEGFLTNGASALHFAPVADGYGARVRVDGVVRDAGVVQPNVLEPLVERLEQTSGLHRHVTPTRRGDKITLLRHWSHDGSRHLSELGLSERDAGVLRDRLRGEPGVTIVSGPRDSGLSTTLYAALSQLDTPDRILATIDERVAEILEGVDQLDLGRPGAETVASGLATLLDGDPDVILVGELGDAAAARLALEAGVEGLRILTGLRAASAVSAIGRLSELVAAPRLVADALTCVVSQRLLRAICENCGETYYATETDLAELGLGSEDGGPRLLARGRGCETCHGSGYRGRVAAFEVLPMTAEIRQLISRETSDRRLRRAAEKGGMRSLREDAVRLCLEGLTTSAEVRRVLGPAD